MKKRKNDVPLADVFKNALDTFEHKIAPKYVTYNDCMIRTKTSNIIPYTRNHFQKKLAKFYGIENQLVPRMTGRRAVILKGRQMGCTTESALTIFLMTINTPNSIGAIIAHDADSTANIFNMVKRAYDRLPEHIKPKAKYNSKTELYWPDLDSQILVGTAGTSSFGRSYTINNVLASEVAFWRSDAKDLLAGLEEAVPTHGNIIIESTANGIGNFYHEMYTENALYDKFFAPWYVAEDYEADPIDVDLYTKEDLEYIQSYNLSPKQAAWMYYKRKTLGRLFNQEYPATPVMAFISSGSNFFNIEILNDYFITAQNTTQVVAPNLPTLVKCNNYSTAEFYATKNSNKKYVISADTSEGDIDNVKSDYTSIDVLCVDDYVQVAHIYGKIDPDTLAEVLCELGYYYNDAVVVVERNNHGHTTLSAMLKSGYPKFDQRESRGLYYHKDYDASRKIVNRKPGFPTTSKTKPQVLDSLNVAITEKTLTINSKTTINQLSYYLRLGNNKYGAPRSMHDDAVMSLAIGHYIMQSLAFKPKARPKPFVRRGNYYG